jgi:Glycosyltransferase Family 4
MSHTSITEKKSTAFQKRDGIGAALSIFGQQRRKLRIALVGGFAPRQCGIATFSSDIHASLTTAMPDIAIDVYPMTPVTEDIEFMAPVATPIREGDRSSFHAAAQMIEQSCADVVWLQHEFGLFGGPAGDCIFDLVDAIAAPLIVTLHTVLPDPDADQRRVMDRLIARAEKLIVMSQNACHLLRDIYRVDEARIALVPHGVPDRPFGRAARFKHKFGP